MARRRTKNVNVRFVVTYNNIPSEAHCRGIALLAAYVPIYGTLNAPARTPGIATYVRSMIMYVLLLRV